MAVVKEVVKQSNDTDCSVACLAMLATAIPALNLDFLLNVALPFRVGCVLGENDGKDLCYTPTSDELACALNSFAGCQAGVLRTRNYYEHFISERQHNQWCFANRLHYRKEQLLELARGKLALLIVRSRNVRGGFHLVVWDEDRLLDPDPTIPLESPAPRDWDSYEVLEAILIWNTEQACRN